MPCAGQWRFDGSAPLACAPSWTSAPAPRNPPCRRGPGFDLLTAETRSLDADKIVGTSTDGTASRTATKAVASASVEPLAADRHAALRRLQLASMRRNAAEVLQVAKTPRWTPEDPADLGRGRDRRPRCLQHSQPPQGRGVRSPRLSTGSTYQAPESPKQRTTTSRGQAAVRAGFKVR